MKILNLIDISFSYNNNEFIKNLSLSVGKGEFIGLIGPNGSGKSTVLKLAAGLIKPRSGQITLWEKPISEYRGKDRAKLISYLPQMLDLNVPFRTKEIISMGLYPYDVPPEVTLKEAMEKVGLADKADHMVTELSGGEKRRVFIAMTLLQGAGILLLDEPLANLDIKYQIELIKLLKRLRKTKSISIIMALHDINMVFQFDRVYIINGGNMFASGKPGSLITGALLKEVFEVDMKVYHQNNGSVLFGY